MMSVSLYLCDSYSYDLDFLIWYENWCVLTAPSSYVQQQPLPADFLLWSTESEASNSLFEHSYKVCNSPYNKAILLLQ